ncbi:MAG: hypothetical protein P8J86_09760 [Phycisphaerales bacterium]|nr:hypothetical protein [Phycisphaerales bacterium]
MAGLVTASLLAWPVLCLMFFLLLRARTAVVVSVFFAVLFLPMGSIEFSGFVNFNKYNSASLGVLLGVVLFDSMRIMTFRLKWIDAPIIIYACSAFMSSISNGLGVYDGISGLQNNFMIWMVPYFVGRIYFSTPEGMRFLAKSIVIWVLVYLPFVAYEIRMSPQLHRMLYGYSPLGWSQLSRGSGAYRPAVFMQHGLMVSLWITSGGLAAFCLWQGKARRQIAGVPAILIAATDALFVFLSNSFGSLLILLGLVASVLLGRATRWTMVLVLVVSVVPTYTLARVILSWEPTVFVEGVDKYVSTARASSFQFRVDNERLMIDKTMGSRPLLGYGGWGRGRIYSESGRDLSITDSYWIIVLSSQGLLGLVAFLAVLVVPVYGFAYRVRVRCWREPWAAGGLALVTVIIAFTFDSISNAMFNPIYVLAIGAVAGFVVHPSWQKANSKGRTLRRSGR